MCFPTLQAVPAEKHKFHSDLHCLLRGILVDGHNPWRFQRRSGLRLCGLEGRHGVGNGNNNGVCYKNSTQSINSSSQTTFFSSLKTTWMHPWFKHWHYVLMRQFDLTDIMHTRVELNVKYHSDCGLVCWKLKLHFKLKPRKEGSLKKKKKGQGWQFPIRWRES